MNRIIVKRILKLLWGDVNSFCLITTVCTLKVCALTSDVVVFNDGVLHIVIIYVHSIILLFSFSST